MLLRMWALALGFALDLAVGDPEWFPHPVRLIGKYITWMEGLLRRRAKRLRIAAVWLTASTVLITMGATALVLWALSLMGEVPLVMGMAIVSWLCLSARNLADEATGVEVALEKGVAQGRVRVARIVGRDTDRLTAEEIIKACVETVAENLNDGVIAPIVYLALGGPIVGMGFKAASTLDSMVGYMDEKYRDIGWASARLDDVLGYVPARVCAALMCAVAPLVGLDGGAAVRMVARDHGNHLSPNCAWSEAAAAGALGIQLGGAHAYFGKLVEKETIGDATRAAEGADIARVNRLLYATAGIAAALACLALWLIA
ncbi:MAG: adenosylcobinamide-phosphate synthase CbiB [Clostridia bacterium]